MNNRPRYALLAILLLGLFLLPRTAQGDDRFGELDSYVREAMQQWKVPGLALAVVKDDQVVLLRSYGYAQLGGDVPITDESVFPIASCTKSFTACGIALLVDQRAVRWDDPIRRHLSEFKVADSFVTRQATIRDLLCHRTGLVRGDLIGMSGGFSDSEMADRMRQLPQAAPFRTAVTYNNLMYWTLGRLIESKSGLKWEDFVAQRVLQPLRMTATATHVSRVASARRVTRHRIYDGQLKTLQTLNADRMHAAGAIHSTASDMAKWVLFHLREGEANGRRLVSVASMREMHALQQSIPLSITLPRRVYDAQFIGTGLGWFVRDYRGRRVVYHGGAWGAEMAFVPEESLGVVVLSNRDWNGLVRMLVYDLIDAYLAPSGERWTKEKKWGLWMYRGGPDAMDRTRLAQLAKHKAARKPEREPSLPLDKYAGTFRTPLYPTVQLQAAGRELHVTFGSYQGSLQHWDGDQFYGRGIVEPFLDWLVKFDVRSERIVGFEIVHVGWANPDERFLFKRVE